ncbi:MAG: hypothetical protein KJP02_05405 [Octadecabacter sp.]|nr:hypothetical protein [Octadecabacter sp.]
MSLDEYRAFVQSKAHLAGSFGFKPLYTNPHAFEFQNSLIEWQLEKGRAATFADCGLGKTLMQLTWAENVHRKTNKPVLILAPLSVASQTVDEAAKFDIEAARSREGEITCGIVTTNYQRLHYFDPADFGGVACDESSILKNDKGATRATLTRFLSQVPYRAMFTATPAPNDHTELGTTSEALGALPHMEMLEAFFVSNDNSLHPDHMGEAWRFKPHAEPHFWRWVSSWARVIRKPSDIGFSDVGYDLPELNEIKHTVKSDPKDGDMFVMPARNLPEVREERKATLDLRCAAAADLIQKHEAGVMWCQFNAEADALAKAVPGAVNLSGADPDEVKEEKFDAFRSGEIKYLVTKPSIAAMGVNWQHVNAFTYFDDYSYEQYYQAVRRMWRFGQKRPVYGYQIGTEGLAGVTRNRARKAEKAERMFHEMMTYMMEAQSRASAGYEPMKPTFPEWMK